MITIAHIHSGTSFVNDSYKFFSNSSFNNLIIVLTDKTGSTSLNEDNILFFESKPKSVHNIIDICSEVDFVVIYNLDIIKAYIVNRIPLNVKVLWRFFGTELYSQIPNQVFSGETTLFLKNKENNFNFLKKYIRPQVSRLKWKTNLTKELDKSRGRIDYFLGLSDMEYIFLKGIWNDLPKFLQIPFSFLQFKNGKVLKHRNIILGNNRSHFNNHFEILKLISNENIKANYSFYLMFSYGEINEYSEKVKAKATKLKNVFIIEEYMSIEEYKKFYLSVDALVINCYRQMGMYAIFEAFSSNVKVYLNKRNVMFHWLRENGFQVFSLNDFSKDLMTDNLNLSLVEREINRIKFHEFRKKYCEEDFHNKIFAIQNQ